MSEFESLIFYLTCFTFSTIFFYIGEKKKNKFFKFIAFMIPILIGGLRYDVGTDYRNYIALYKTYSQYSLHQYLLSEGIFEIFFFFIIKLCNIINSNAFLMFFIVNFLSIFFVYKAIDELNLKNKYIIWLAFLMCMFGAFVNIIRQAIAISIMFYIFSLIINEKYKKAKLFSFLPCLFHTSGIICILFTFILCFFAKRGKMKYSKIVVLTFFILFLAIFSFFIIDKIPFLSTYKGYISHRKITNNYSFYLNLIIFALMSLYYRKNINKNPKISLLYFIYAIFLAFTALGFYSAFVKRINLYFSFGQYSLWSQFFDLFENRQNNKILHLLIIIYLYSYFIIGYIQGSDIFPYNFIFEFL